MGEPGGELTRSLAVLIMGQVCLLHLQGWLQNTEKGDQSGYRTSSPAPVFFFFFQDILWTKDPQFKFPILTAQYPPSNTNTHVDAGNSSLNSREGEEPWGKPSSCLANSSQVPGGMLLQAGRLGSKEC